jgi:hypothetical protein
MRSYVAAPVSLSLSVRRLARVKFAPVVHELLRVTVADLPSGTGYVHASASTRYVVEFHHWNVNPRVPKRGTCASPEARMSIRVFTIFREATVMNCSPVRFHAPCAGIVPDSDAKTPSRIPVPTVSITYTSCDTPATVTLRTLRTSARARPSSDTVPSNVVLKEYSQKSPIDHAGASIAGPRGARTPPENRRRIVSTIARMARTSRRFGRPR